MERTDCFTYCACWWDTSPIGALSRAATVVKILTVKKWPWLLGNNDFIIQPRTYRKWYKSSLWYIIIAIDTFTQLPQLANDLWIEPFVCSVCKLYESLQLAVKKAHPFWHWRCSRHLFCVFFFGCIDKHINYKPSRAHLCSKAVDSQPWLRWGGHLVQWNPSLPISLGRVALHGQGAGVPEPVAPMIPMPLPSLVTQRRKGLQSHRGCIASLYLASLHGFR